MANGAQMMSIRVLCIVADGVEETELVAPVDILRRAGAEVVMATPNVTLQVTGKHGIRIEADSLLNEVEGDSFDALLLPGGPAVLSLRKEGRVAGLAKSFGAHGKVVAAICAAPLLLRDAGLLDGRRHTAHFTTYGELTRAEAGERVIVDGNVITSRGAGTAVEFGLAVASHLVGEGVAQEVADAIMA